MDAAAANVSLNDDYGDDHGADAPATWYLAFFRDSTFATELTTTGGIARIPLPNTSVYWPDAAGGEKSNAGGPVSSAASTGVWAYDATGWALMTAATGGNRGDGGDCDPVSNETIGTVLTVNDGDLVIAYELD